MYELAVSLKEVILLSTSGGSGFGDHGFVELSGAILTRMARYNVSAAL